MAGRKTASQRSLHSNLYILPYMVKNFADEIKVKDLEMRKLAWII